MYRRAIIITLAFAIVLSIGAPLRAQAAAGHKLSSPRFCFGSVPIACAAPLKSKAVQTLSPATTIAAIPPASIVRWLDRRRLRIRLAADYDFFQTNTVGAQGSGKAIDAMLKVTFPGGRFSNTMIF
jgi:hypothetical protein